MPFAVVVLVDVRCSLDFHFGFLGGAHTYLPGKTNNDPLLHNGQSVKYQKEYRTYALAGEAVSLIERSKGKPFFLYFAFKAVQSSTEASGGLRGTFPAHHRHVALSALFITAASIGQDLTSVWPVD